MPISTAWAWWLDMSRAKPASAECSPGSVSRGVSHPAAYPMSTHATAATTASDDLAVASPLVSQRAQRSYCPGGRSSGVSDGVGDAAAAAAPRLLGGVLPQRVDELVDPPVVGVVDLELVAPRLQRDRLVQARVRAHQHEARGHAPCSASSSIWSCGRSGWYVTHTAPCSMLCDGLLLGDLRRVDVAHAVLPVVVVHATDRRAARVGQDARPCGCPPAGTGTSPGWSPGSCGCRRSRRPAPARPAGWPA